jgi:hypothetical protein
VNTNAFKQEELIADVNGGWHVVDRVNCLVTLVRKGLVHKFRRPRGPVTLTYTPPDSGG